MGYINVLYGCYKKVINKLMLFSPSAKCFYEDAFSNILRTVLSESLWQSLYFVFIKV